jgi:hypothetical protein
MQQYSTEWHAMKKWLGHVILSAAKNPGQPGGRPGPRGCFAAAQHDTREGLFYGMP